MNSFSDDETQRAIAEAERFLAECRTVATEEDSIAHILASVLAKTAEMQQESGDLCVQTLKAKTILEMHIAAYVQVQDVHCQKSAALLTDVLHFLTQQHQAWHMLHYAIARCLVEDVSNE